MVSIGFSYANTGLAILSGLVLVPVYLHYLGMAGYGIWLASGGVVALLAAMDGGLSQVVAQRLATAAGARNAQDFAAVAGSGWVLGAAVSCAVLVVGLAAAAGITRIIGVEPEATAGVRVAFLLSVIGAACSLVQVNVFSASHARQEPRFVGITSLAATASGLVTSIVFLVRGHGIVAMGLGATVRGSMGMLMALGYTWRKWRQWGLPAVRVSRPELRWQMRQTAPLVLGRLGTALAANGEATIAAAFIAPEAAAILGLTSRLYSLGEMLVNPFAGAVFPSLAHLAGSSEQGRVKGVIRALVEGFSALGAMVACGATALNGPFVSLWVGPDRFGGEILSLLLGVAMLVGTRVNLLVSALSALGDLGRPALISFGDVLLRLLAMTLLLPAFGIRGIPAAKILSLSLVSLALLTRLLVKALGGGNSALSAAFAGARTIAAGGLVTGAWMMVARGPGSWAGLGAQGLLLAAILAMTVLLASSFARKQVRSLISGTGWVLEDGNETSKAA